MRIPPAAPRRDDVQAVNSPCYNPGMSDERKRRWWPAALASILLMYPLSIGPAYRLVIAGYLDFDVCLEAYMPVLWVAEQSDLADKLLQWYMQLWAPQNIEAYH